MNIEKRYIENEKSKEILTQEINESKNIVHQYREESKELQEKIEQLKDKYNITKHSNRINENLTKISRLQNEHVIYFISKIFVLMRKIERKNLNIDVEVFLNNNGIDLIENDSDNICLRKLFYDVEDNSIYEDVNDIDSNPNIIAEFDAGISAKTLQDIIEELETLIETCDLYNFFLKNINLSKKNKKLINLLKIYNIEIIEFDNFNNCSIQVCKDKIKLIDYNANKPIFIVKKSCDYKKIKESLEIDIRNIENELKLDEDYNLYLKLKEKYE